MILMALTHFQIPQIPDNYDNYGRLIECSLSGNAFWNIYSLAFSFETNLIQKYMQSYTTVTTMNATHELSVQSKFTLIF